MRRTTVLFLFQVFPASHIWVVWLPNLNTNFLWLMSHREKSSSMATPTI